MKSKCKVRDCNSASMLTGEYCPAHDYRNKRYGNPTATPIRNPRTARGGRTNRYPDSIGTDCFMEGCDVKIDGRLLCKRHYGLLYKDRMIITYEGEDFDYDGWLNKSIEIVDAARAAETRQEAKADPLSSPRPKRVTPTAIYAAPNKKTLHIPEGTEFTLLMEVAGKVIEFSGRMPA